MKDYWQERYGMLTYGTHLLRNNRLATDGIPYTHKTIKISLTYGTIFNLFTVPA